MQLPKVGSCRAGHLCEISAPVRYGEAEPLPSVAIRKSFLTVWLTSSGASAPGTQASVKPFESGYAHTELPWSLLTEKKGVKIFLLGHLSFQQSWFSGHMIRKCKENTFKKIILWKWSKGNSSFSRLCPCVKVLTWSSASGVGSVFFAVLSLQINRNKNAALCGSIKLLAAVTGARNLLPKGL